MNTPQALLSNLEKRTLRLEMEKAKLRAALTAVLPWLVGSGVVFGDVNLARAKVERALEETK